HFKQRTDKVDGGPLLQAILAAIERQDQADGVLSLRDQQKAQTVPWLADRLSRLIVGYESEWHWDSGKWDELDSLMGEGLPDWQAEKTRIKRLAFWDEVSSIAGFPTGPKAFHLHPGGLVGNFALTMGRVTLRMLLEVFDTAKNHEFIRAIADELNQNLESYKLNTPLRISHFFAQVLQEVGRNCRVVEIFDYPPAGLINTFGYFSKNKKEAEMYGRTADHPADQEAIANRAYSNRNGHGGPETGDGWKYRGRGLKMLTWRANYDDFRDKYPLIWSGESIDAVQNPDLLLEPKYALRSAVFFWLRYNLFNIADKGSSDECVDSITAVINKGTDSYEARRSNFQKIWSKGIFNDI
ncbi:putative chitinase, partial [Chitinivorax tropicus]|nr:putative chitinase [Chitinivorax tropicus]